MTVALSGAHVVFRTPDGALLGSSPIGEVASPLAHALLGFPGSADGFSLPLANGSVLGLDASAPAGVVGFAFRTGAGRDLATEQVPREESDALAEWLLSCVVGTSAAGWPARRQDLLAAISTARSARQQAESSGSTDDVAAARSAEAGARQRYADALPRVPVARDPFGGEVVALPLDPAGLDGPCWDADNPARPAPPMPPSYVVTTGSMRVGRSRLEPFGHLALPGPALPFVLPDLLSRDGWKAVLATVPIGPHLGHVVSYFCEHPPPDEPTADEWGRRDHWTRDADGYPVTILSAPRRDRDRDPDLRPWIESGKLGWIAPGDATMRVRWAVAQCPYLTPRAGVTLDVREQRVQAGEVW